MFGLDTFEIIVIVFLAILLFGRDLPRVARAVGRGLGEFRRSLKDIEEEMRDTLDMSDYAIPPVPPSCDHTACDRAVSQQEVNPFPEKGISDEQPSNAPRNPDSHEDKCQI